MITRGSDVYSIGPEGAHCPGHYWGHIECVREYQHTTGGRWFRWNFFFSSKMISHRTSILSGPSKHEWCALEGRLFLMPSKYCHGNAATQVETMFQCLSIALQRGGDEPNSGHYPLGMDKHGDDVVEYVGCQRSLWNASQMLSGSETSSLPDDLTQVAIAR
jgi:hypothetical protein